MADSRKKKDSEGIKRKELLTERANALTSEAKKEGDALEYGEVTDYFAKLLYRT